MTEESEQKSKNLVTMRKSTLALLFGLCGVLAVGTGVGVVRTWQYQKTYGSLETLAATVDANYYTDVDRTAAMDGVLKGYVAGLDDPYSQYMTDEEYDSFMTNESGEMVGIGVTVSLDEDGYLLVQAVTKDSPAEKAGLEKDDVIMTVNDLDVAELGYEDAVSEVRGPVDTTVKLSIRRGKEVYLREIKRERIEVVTVQGQMLDDKIGYIRISAFKENTFEQFQKVFDALTKQGAKALVFDLRDNGGGLVSSLEAVLDPLLPEGEIAIATYRDGTAQTLVTSDAEECNLPMAVIVNGNSASAAELFTASLSDFEKATVVGTTTFGKGIMQVTQSLPDGGALTLTVATYQTTRGECYHKIGITPDEVVEADDFVPDFEHPDTKKDAQLKAAVQTVQEKF